MNYTHILSIKILDFPNMESVNIMLEDMIKTEFLEKKQLYNGIQISWRRKSLTPLEKIFHIGDIVIDSPLNSDDLLLNITRQTISEINRKMHENNLLSKDQSIIFKIMKPLTTRIPLADGAGYIYDF